MSIPPATPKPQPASPQDIAIVRQARLEDAAEQFEAMFLQQMLKQMRKAGDVLSEGSSMRSRQGDTLREMHDEAMAQTLATHRQTGIADLLVKQLSRGEAAAADSVHAGHRDMPPAPAAPQMADSLLTPIVNTWQRGVATVTRGAAALMALVERVIAHESAGQVAAVSSKGARGLMQLMPDTAREMAHELNVEYSEQRLITDGAYNKRLGVAYLDKLIKRYEGATVLAVAAYNAGPGRVDEWLKVNGDPRRGPISVSQWVERIPFAETRNYTRSILADLEPAAVPLAAAVMPPARADLPMKTIGLKPLPDPVALEDQVATSTISTAAAFSSAAFAPNMRLVRKEIES